MRYMLSDERRTTYRVTEIDGSLQIDARVWVRCDTGIGDEWWNVEDRRIKWEKDKGTVPQQRGYVRRGGVMATDDMDKCPTSPREAYRVYREALARQLVEAENTVAKLRASLAVMDDHGASGCRRGARLV